MVGTRPKLFWTVQIVLNRCKLFWSGPKPYGRVQIILVRFKLDFMDQFLLFEPVQNDCYSAKMIWTVQNNFGPIEGQGINESICIDLHLLHVM